MFKNHTLDIHINLTQMLHDALILDIVGNPLSATLHLPRKGTDRVFFLFWQWHVGDDTQRFKSEEQLTRKSVWSKPLATRVFSYCPRPFSSSHSPILKIRPGSVKKISASKYALRWISISAYINQTPYGIYKIWFLFRNLSAFSILRFDFLKHNKVTKYMYSPSIPLSPNLICIITTCIHIKGMK